MLDIGFRPDIEKILRRCPKERQTFLLSATVPPPILHLARRYMRDPQSLDFSPQNLAVETIDQYYFTVEHEKKFELLVRLLIRDRPRQAIVFCRTKRGTERLYQRLSKLTAKVECIHGDMQQSARDRVMGLLRSGKLRLLIATDVVGRGIDVTGISHIVNFDIPQFCDDYVHRVGRTGRMGREGVAYTFVEPDQGFELTRIEQRINKLLKRDEIRGVEAPRPQVEETLEGEKPAEAEKRKPPPFGPRRPPVRRGM
jgi:ATP-dependent RNA helicase DeaD